MTMLRLLVLALGVAFSLPAQAAGLIAAAPPPAIIADLSRAHALADKPARQRPKSQATGRNWFKPAAPKSMRCGIWRNLCSGPLRCPT
jgi:hypothetical protein